MNIRSTAAVLMVSAGLSGCVTFGQFNEGLNALVGQPERVAFDVLGYPNVKQQFGGDVVYVWGRSSSGALFLPQTSTTTGYVGTTPVYGTTTSTQVIPVNYNCTIKLVVNDKGVIRKWEYDGNLGGCEAYITRLNQYRKGGR